MTRKKYPSELGRPMTEPTLERFFRGLLLTFKHYDIDMTDSERFTVLALKLMVDHVPYFQARGKRGPKANPWRTAALAAQVEIQKLRGAKSTRAALVELEGKEGEADSLARRLREAQKNNPLVKMMQKTMQQVASGKDLTGRRRIAEKDIAPLLDDLREILRGGVSSN